MSTSTWASAEWESQSLPVELQVGYAVRTLDLNNDSKMDILIADSKRFVWLENPSWQVHVIHDTPHAKSDNVCMAPYDIDGDGVIDLAIGHDWRGADDSPNELGGPQSGRSNGVDRFASQRSWHQGAWIRSNPSASFAIRNP